MTIDTGKRTQRMQAQKQLFAIIGALLVVLTLFEPMRSWVDEIGLNRLYFGLTIAAIYIAYRLYFRIRTVEYLYVSDTALPGFLRIRHFKILPMVEGKFAIEIPLSEMLRYEETIWGHGLRRSITIWQQRGNQQYTYPPFSTTILTHRERMQLYQILDQHCQQHAQ